MGKKSKCQNPKPKPPRKSCAQEILNKLTKPKECEEEAVPPRQGCLREILDKLIINHNDFQRLNSELKNLQIEFKNEMQRLQFPCQELKKLECCPKFDNLEGENFEERIGKINEVYNCFTKRIDDMNEHVNKLLENSRICLTALEESKKHVKRCHDRKLEDLKRAILEASDDPKKIECYEMKICQLQRNFAKEVAYVKQVENNLQLFFERVKESMPEPYIETDCFKEYDWLPSGKNFSVVDASGSQIVSKMGHSLVQAFTRLHIQQPADPKGFLAAYFLKLDRNQKLLQEKMNILNTHVEETIF